MTRVGTAVIREQIRIKRARPEAVERTDAVFASGPEPIKAVAIVRLGMERGQISPQEGAQLTYYATHYAEVGLAERIVLALALAELSGRSVADIRPPLLV